MNSTVFKVYLWLCSWSFVILPPKSVRWILSFCSTKAGTEWSAYSSLCNHRNELLHTLTDIYGEGLRSLHCLVLLCLCISSIKATTLSLVCAHMGVFLHWHSHRDRLCSHRRHGCASLLFSLSLFLSVITLLHFFIRVAQSLLDSSTRCCRCKWPRSIVGRSYVVAFTS